MDKLSKGTKEAITLIYDNYLHRWTLAYLKGNEREKNFNEGVLFAINRLFYFDKSIKCVGFDNESIEILKNIAKINKGYGGMFIDDIDITAFRIKYPEFFTKEEDKLEERLKILGYRKVDENDVVLPKSEYEDLKDMADTYLEMLKGKREK